MINQSSINTVIVAAVTTNLRLAHAPGNFRLGAGRRTGLSQPSVVNVAQLLSIDKSRLTARTGRLDDDQLHRLDSGLKFMLALR